MEFAVIKFSLTAVQGYWIPQLRCCIPSGFRHLTTVLPSMPSSTFVGPDERIVWHVNSVIRTQSAYSCDAKPSLGQLCLFQTETRWLLLLGLWLCQAACSKNSPYRRVPEVISRDKLILLIY